MTHGCLAGTDSGNEPTLTLDRFGLTNGIELDRRIEIGEEHNEQEEDDHVGPGRAAS